MSDKNPILRDLPMPIKTHRLLLRPPMPGDGPELNAAVSDSLKELQPWMPFADHVPTQEESEENVRRAYAKWILREDLRVSIFARDGKTMVGSTGLHRINWSVPLFELGLWCRTKFAGQGYMTEAGAALTKYAFVELGAKRVLAQCDEDNLRSKKVIERLGFRFEGTLHCDALKTSGALRNTLMFARTDMNELPDVGAEWERRS